MKINKRKKKKNKKKYFLEALENITILIPTTIKVILTTTIKIIKEQRMVSTI